MATTLTDKNVNTACNGVKDKGLRTKFWREHRSGACKGSGVGKALDALEKLGLPADGSVAKIAPRDLAAIVDGLKTLDRTMDRAISSCKGAQAHSKKFCEAYKTLAKSVIEKAETRDVQERGGLGNTIYKPSALLKAKYYTLGSSVEDLAGVEKDLKAIPISSHDGRQKAKELRQVATEYTKERKSILIEIDKCKVAIAEINSLKPFIYGDLVRKYRDAQKAAADGVKVIKQAMAALKRCDAQLKIAAVAVKGLPAPA